MEITEQIAELLSPHLNDGEFFVVDIKASASKIRSKITILVDSDEGIGIDDLGRISRAIGDELEGIMPNAYTLEVSSPGVDTPLTFPRMYKKNVGRALKVTINEWETVKGELVEVNDESFTVQPEKNKKQKETPEPITLAYANVQEVKVLVSFK